MALNTIGVGAPFTSLGTPQIPWAFSPQSYGAYGGQSPFQPSPFQQSPFQMTPFSGFNPHASQPFQQIAQLFQILPQQLQQLLQLEYLQQYQLQQLQHILQLIPAQLAQLQQLIQLVPQHIQQPLGQMLGAAGTPGLTPWGAPSQLFSAQPGYVM